MKKNYYQPSVEATQLQPHTIVLAPGTSGDGNMDNDGNGGPSFIPD